MSFINLQSLAVKTPAEGVEIRVVPGEKMTLVFFYLKSVAPEGITTGDIYRSIFHFLGVLIVGMALIMMFPQIALWLPN